MSSSMMNKAGMALFEKHLHQYAPADPMYETYTDKKGKTKRRKRAVPSGLSARDTKILKSVQRRAHYLDKGFKICGFRFGWTAIIGIIPGAGDVADASLNYFLVVRKARQADLPSWLVRKMLANNAVSVVAGLIPIAGDIVLAAYKANSRNAALLEEFLRIRGDEFLKLEAEQKNKAAGSALAPAGTSTGRKSVEGRKSAERPPASDVEQVKPGAGAEGGTVDQKEGTMPAQKPAKSKSLLVWRSGSTKKKDSKFVEDVGSSGSSVPQVGSSAGTPVKKAA